MNFVYYYRQILRMGEDHISHLIDSRNRYGDIIPMSDLYARSDHLIEDDILWIYSP